MESAEKGRALLNADPFLTTVCVYRIVACVAGQVCWAYPLGLFGGSGPVRPVTQVTA